MSVQVLHEEDGTLLCNVETWNTDTEEWDWCTRQAHTSGLCTRHYQSVRRAEVKVTNVGTRKSPIYESTGDLPDHMRFSWDTPMPFDVTGPSAQWCQFLNCQRPSPTGNGWCEVHWNQALKDWDAPPSQPGPHEKACAMCGGKHYAKGYCRRHYMQQHSTTRHDGDLEKYIRAVYPIDGGYAELDGCGLDEPTQQV